MIAVDTNILIHAHWSDSPWHDRADAHLTALAESGIPWAIPWPCVHEFLSIATHPRIHDPPTPVLDALEQAACWLEAPALTLLSEGVGYWSVLQRLLRQSKVSGPKIHDARIAALCLHHGASPLWSADRDFSRFRDLKVVNPLIEDWAC